MPNRSSQWLLMVYHFPQDPGSLRVKVWRRLQSIGAISLKGAVYVLPANSQSQEDFGWLLREIQNGGGEGVIAEADFVAGMNDAQVKAMFDQARQADYLKLAEEIREYVNEHSNARAKGDNGASDPAEALGRFRRKLGEIESIDFFGATGRETVGAELRTAEHLLEPATIQATELSSPAELKVPRGSVWVTRANVFVDRIASAWLIRRWIDPEAVFKFTADKDYPAAKGEFRFDMFDAEFTHEGNQCTYEVLCSRFGLQDPALQKIGEIVHDIDLKDNKFRREETAGVAQLISGIAAHIDGDTQRIERGSRLLDDLYESFRVSRRQ